MVRRAAILAAVFWAAAAAAQAQQAASCRLALALALDVSSSVDAEEYELQRLGLAAALDAAEVRHAILHGGRGYVALSIYEWSGFDQQKLHLDWTALRSPADIDRAVLTIGTMIRSHEDYPTAVGQALGYGATLLSRAPPCLRRVIDISGDGINNYGFGPDEAYRHFPFAGVVVNGLVILGNHDSVVEFYRETVLHGDGAFLTIADGFREFRETMTRKLYREISDTVLGHAPTPGRPRG